mmetsp:Transcript_60741/g.98310  ORF Transcript_60741/g.98310 Transcript_60741/m.98310 type:complete len:320 (-) Transcript_60741:50-1009(-)
MDGAESSSMPMNVVENNVVLFGVPKKGRIFEDVMKILKGAGLDFKRPERLDVAMCKELSIKIVFLPAADIPTYVMDGSVDIGISGSDMLEETLIEAGRSEDSPIQVIMKLGIGKCKLCLQAPVETCKDGAKAFAGKRIVTSFPALSRRFFETFQEKDGPKTRIKVVSGSVEAACGLGLADAVIDLVETGTTMKAAGLDIVAEVFETEALFFQQKPTEQNGLMQGSTKADLITLVEQRIRGYMTATSFVMVVCNCHDANLQEVCAICPGKKSPTVTELKEPGWHSVSALVSIKSHNMVMDKLAKAGATDILCLALSNTRM